MARVKLHVRAGPRVEKAAFPSLDEALDALAERASGLTGRTTRSAVELRVRRFEPAQQVAARLEISAPGGVRGGLDVRGDGSAEAYTGRLRRKVVEQRPGEDPVAALRRALTGLRA